MATTENMLRVGVVSSVDASSKTARVIYSDSGVVSGWLYVVQQPMSGNTGYTEGHRHSLSVSGWMPMVNDRVLCAILCGDDTDGYILGAIST